MKKTLEEKGVVTASSDGKQKKIDRAVISAVALFFILSAFTFMNFLYCLSDCIGSVVCASPDVALRDAVRSLPIILSFFLSLSGLMTAHAFYRNENFSILRKHAKKHAILGIVIGVILILYVFALLFAGRYLSLTEGAPSPLYPLDAILYAALYIALGIAVLIYLHKTALFNGPSRPPVQKRGGGVRAVFRTVWLFVSLYGFCGFFYSLFIVDFAHGYVPYSLAMMLACLVAFLTLAVWEFYYNNRTEEKRNEIALPLGLVSLATSAAAAILYFIALKHNLDGPSNVGFGILPIAFSASVNIATLLVVVMPLIVSAAAVCKGLIRRAKSRKK